MRIASRFNRPEAPVTIGDTTYFFKPDPKDPNGPCVAEVTNTAHISRFLSIVEGYYLPEDGAQQKAKKPTPPPPDPNAGKAPAGAGAGDAGDQGDQQTATGELTDEDRKAAGDLLELSRQALQPKLTKGEVQKHVVAEALRLEEAKPEDEQRGTIIKILKKALEG